MQFTLKQPENRVQKGTPSPSLQVRGWSYTSAISSAPEKRMVKRKTMKLRVGANDGRKRKWAHTMMRGTTLFSYYLLKGSNVVSI